MHRILPGKFHIELPLYIDVAMTALPFYVAGFWVRRYNFFLFPSHRFDKIIPSFVLLALVVMYFTATTPGMRTNNYPGNIFQGYIAAFAGIFMIMLICKKIKRISIVSYLVIFHYHTQYSWTDYTLCKTGRFALYS